MEITTSITWIFMVLIATLWQHSRHTSYVAPLEYFLDDRLKGLMCTFYTLSGNVGHILHYIKVFQPPYKWTEEKQNINTQTVAFQTHILCGSS
jgi:hypothetical protein